MTIHRTRWNDSGVQINREMMTFEEWVTAAGKALYCPSAKDPNVEVFIPHPLDGFPETYTGTYGHYDPRLRHAWLNRHDPTEYR